jgi:hypothetical protein
VNFTFDTGRRDGHVDAQAAELCQLCQQGRANARGLVFREANSEMRMDSSKINQCRRTDHILITDIIALFMRKCSYEFGVI